MKRTIFALTIAMLMMAAPLVSAQHGNKSPKPVKTTVKTTVKAPKPVAHASSPKSGMSHGGTKKMTGASVKPVKPAKAPKVTKTTTTTTKGTKAAKPTKTAKADKPSKTGKTTTTTTTTTTTSTTPTTTTSDTPTTPLSPAQQKLLKNTKLAAKLQSRLPAGTDVNAAASGFRNLGQFVAAVNVSNNLGIPFAELKMRMVDQGMSLGQAIQDSRSGMTTTDTTTQVRRAETDADVMIRTTETTTTTTTTTTAAKKAKPRKTTGGRK